MADLLIKPLTGAGNTVTIQDQAGGAILTSENSGATIGGGVAIPAAGITGTLPNAVQDNITRTGTLPVMNLAPTATASAPAGVEGAMYYDSDKKAFMTYVTSWVKVSQPDFPFYSGKYDLVINGESVTTHVITRYSEGPYVKVYQQNNDVEMDNSAAINAGGTWVDAEVNLHSGKLATSVINYLTDRTKKFAFRVTGNSDTLLNNGAGTSIWTMTDSSNLVRFGSGNRPGSYQIAHDPDSSGKITDYWNYTADGRGVCSYDTDWWYYDHNYYGSGSLPSGGAHQQCYGFGSQSLDSNLHWMGYPAGNSGGAIENGSTSGTALAMYILWE